MASAWGTSWGDPSAWGASWDIGAPAPAVSSTGWAGPKRKKRRLAFDDDEWVAERAARVRLREQIRAALEGPQPVAEAVEEAISEYVRPQKTDSQFLPLDARIDWDRLYRNLAAVETGVLLHVVQARAQMEDDEDEDLLLLNG